MSEPGIEKANCLSLAAANLAALALVIGSGLVHGHLTDRWGTSDAMAEAVADLDRVPRSVGDWRGQDVAMDRRQIDRAGIQGYVARVYRNVRDGRESTVLLVCGRPGPIAVHTPDICYKGSGYESDSEPVNGSVGMADGHPAAYLKARFRKPGTPAPDVLDIQWAWNARGVWEVPANPRFAFAPYSSLYKVYLITRRDGSLTPSADKPPDVDEFAGPIFDAINRSLFARDERATGLSSTSGVPPGA